MRVYVYGNVVPSLLHSVPGRSTRGGVRVVGPCVSYTPSGYESRRRVFAVCGDRSGRERVNRARPLAVFWSCTELIDCIVRSALGLSWPPASIYALLRSLYALGSSSPSARGNG